MKKNILTIVIMAASLINLVLSAVLVFSVMPAMNKTSNLVDKVASIIDLEIEPQDSEEDQYSITDLKVYEIVMENSLKINLQKDPGDTAAHYVVLDGITVSFNPDAEDYDEINTSVQEADIYIRDIVKDCISQYTATTITESSVRQDAVKKIQERYNTKSIVDISLPGFLVA